ARPARRVHRRGRGHAAPGRRGPRHHGRRAARRGDRRRVRRRCALPRGGPERDDVRRLHRALAPPARPPAGRRGAGLPADRRAQGQRGPRGHRPHGRRLPPRRGRPAAGL
ncbi:MAG: hypothetical protein AVDCRST_MAG13-2044, partial [uncultured Solirubrobacteraceae bacterium]